MVIERARRWGEDVRERLPRALAALLALAIFYWSIRVGVWLILAGILAWLLSGSERIYDWVASCGKGLDSAVNAILGGDHRETVSSRIGKAYYLHHKFPSVYERPAWWMRLIRVALDRIENDHVFKAIEPPLGIPLLQEQKDEALHLAQQGIL